MATPTAQQISAGLRGFDRLYGLELSDYSDSEVCATVRVRDELKQPAGLLHGGVYAAVAESLASLGTWLAVAGGGKTAMGMSNSTSFLRPVTEGAVHARAVPLHQGRSTWVWDVNFTDDHGRLCAVTRMTIAVRPARGANDPPSASGAGA